MVGQLAVGVIHGLTRLGPALGISAANADIQRIQFLGLTFLAGAFYAGLLIASESAGYGEPRSISQVFDAMTWGFFIPVFFAFVGLSMDRELLGSSWVATLAFVTLAFFAAFSKPIVGWVVPEY